MTWSPPVIQITLFKVCDFEWEISGLFFDKVVISSMKLLLRSTTCLSEYLDMNKVPIKQ